VDKQGGKRVPLLLPPLFPIIQLLPGSHCRWDKKPSIRGERSKLLFPGSSHLFVLERPTFVIFERPPLIALLSLLQADTITMLHIPGLLTLSVTVLIPGILKAALQGILHQ